MTNRTLKFGALGSISAFLLTVACTGQPGPVNSSSYNLDDLSTTLELDMYSRLAAANIWGFPYVPRISMVIVVDGEHAVIAQVSKRVARHLAEDWNKDPASFTITELGYLMPTVWSAAQHPKGYLYPIVPALVIPTANASMETVGALFDAGAGGYNPNMPVLVAWENKGTRSAVADIWLSRSTEPNAYRIEDEFYRKARSADHSILIMGPEHAIECRAPREGLGPCELQAGRSKLTRIGLCGFDTWGHALAAMETRVSRVTEVALFRDCSFLERKVSELTSQSTLE